MFWTLGLKLEGRILTAEQFEEEASSKFDGLTVEGATRRGRLGTYSAPPNLVLKAFGTGIMMFLQGRIAETCRNVYPVVSFGRGFVPAMVYFPTRLASGFGRMGVDVGAYLGGRIIHVSCRCVKPPSCVDDQRR